MISPFAGLASGKKLASLLRGGGGGSKKSGRRLRPILKSTAVADLWEQEQEDLPLPRIRSGRTVTFNDECTVHEIEARHKTRCCRQTSLDSCPAMSSYSAFQCPQYS